MTNPSEQTILIVGSGFSGTLTAIHLQRQAGNTPLNILMVEKRPKHAQGAAYSTTCDAHLLNVPAWNMSAFPEEPTHFLDWLQKHNHAFAPTALVPRRIYGEYLRDLLKAAQTNKHLPRLQSIQGTVENILPSIDGTYKITLDDQCALTAHSVVLALGNFMPGNPPIADRRFYGSNSYIGNPWLPLPETLDRQAPCLLIGTGLTMVDKLLELKAMGHTGPVYAISRHGFLPNAHTDVSVNAAQGALSWETIEPASTSARAMLQFIRQWIRENADTDWRTVFMRLRPHIQRIWKNFQKAEKSRFLRHLRATWDVHRHLIDAEVSAMIEEMQTTGALKVFAGRIQSLNEIKRDDGTTVVTCTYRPRHKTTDETLTVTTVINCIGPDGSLARSHDPLIVQLRESGQILPDAPGLGLRATDDFQVLNAEAHPQVNLFAVGPMLKGELWESIAVPELRKQAAALAGVIITQDAKASVP